MGRTASTARDGPVLPRAVVDFLYRRLSETIGIFCFLGAAVLLAALVSYDPADPSFNSATTGATHNLLGRPGAHGADLLLQTLGATAAIPALALIVWGWQAFRKRAVTLLWLRVALLAVAVILLSMGLGPVPAPETWPLLTGFGGVTGQILLDSLTAFVRGFAGAIDGAVIALICGLLGLSALVAALGLPMAQWRALATAVIWGARSLRHAVASLSTRAARQAPRRQRIEPTVKRGAADADGGAIGKTRPGAKGRDGLVEARTAKVKAGRRALAARQQSLNLGPSDHYELPPLDLLDLPDIDSRRNAVNKSALEQNARLLETVLEDFGVRGTIVKIRPGPVVTLYELEPAPGTKTSRVIGLSDDIARSMSAVSVRVAVVPGRNAIGIELPNLRREMVYLRELLESDAFERNNGKLTLALGKDIGGSPIFVDLARMPHLLVAGTTGSGKSVAINTMVLSLLYRLSPNECRFIMIDPKVLELSVYEGIPHLLTPVVTEPGKAVVAFKWAVREMEERYRAMAHLGVRSIAAYNARLAEARKKGEVLNRRVQTGFDDSGKPVFEEQPLSMEPLPFIVIVVDEMADLMLVAGKDIEAAVQRLAQMARAAGLHLIMATQRPSVDVITGTIKANFPTRVSFQVTSKIDSRTILGEQGAEQLLGHGDMLHMVGGGRITRIHGPFVSDKEVETVVKYLETQGEPDYLDAVTEDEDGSAFPFPGGVDGAGGSSGDTLYEEAVALIAREGKASTSFIQRHLQIGYNRAARIIERMEDEGIVSKANRVGRREVLIAKDGDYAA
jgi:S-DNA-T family DNA segregation ATPase FtsK/SpoIIIE